MKYQRLMTLSQNSKIALISSSDSNYYAMLREWVHSIRRFPESQGMDICILDAGMTEDQHKEISKDVTKVISPDWPRKLSNNRIKGREFCKACVNRPFLRDLFPGYDYYLWMDADTWVQDWRAIEFFLEGASRNKISLTGSMDRSYPKGMRIKWLGMWPFKASSFYMSNARKAFGMAMAKKPSPFHNLSARAFCLHKDAPHWDKWQEIILKALEKGNVFTAEQLSLGVMLHIEKFPVEILPSYMHWFCEHKLLWDEDRKIFVEPYLPHEPIGILHLAGHDKMRVDRSVLINLETTEGKAISYTYRYPYFNGETGEDMEWFPKTEDQ